MKREFLDIKIFKSNIAEFDKYNGIISKSKIASNCQS